MTKICYVPKKFTKGHFNTIKRANSIIEQYYAQIGGGLTLRQLYYQFVSRGYIPNNMKEYKRLGTIIADARLAGRIDWERIEDRTRGLDRLKHYGAPQEAVAELAEIYHTDLWYNQKYRPEVWIEKDALTGVISRVCEENDVPYFSCRGYTSLSEMWRASMRLQRWIEGGQQPYIIHFGDHDPSGIDMSRDIVDRLSKTFLAGLQFERVALNMDQIQEYSPPPNPAKVRDSRYKAYVAEYGDESWELDALDPGKFRELIEAQLTKLREPKQWKKDNARREQLKDELRAVAVGWDEVKDVKRRLSTTTSQLATTAEQLSAAMATIAQLEAKAKKPKKKG
jgi:hypothetical protein